MNFSLLGVFGAGLLTFLSPCVLPLVPILTASLVVTGDSSRWARLKGALWFSVGFAIVFVSLGLGLSALAPFLGHAKPYLLGFGGLIFALFGLKMMGYFKSTTLNRSFHIPDIRSRFPKGMQGLVFGMLFGLSWTPCVGPVLGGVLTYVASQERSTGEGAALLLSFATGISLPILLFAVAADRLTPVLNRLKKHLPRIEYAAGLGLFVFGIYIAQQARFLPAENANLGPSSNLAVTLTSGDRIALQEAGNKSARMLFFYSEHCPICRAMEPFLPSVEKSCAGDDFQLLRVNVDLPENQAAAARFSVRATPTIALLSPSGKELVHLVGFQTEGRLIEAAKTVTSVACNGNKWNDKDKLKDPFPAPEMNPGQTCSEGKVC